MKGGGSAIDSFSNFFFKVFAHECKHCLCLNTLDQFKFADAFFRYYSMEVRKAIDQQKQKHNDTNMAENFKTEFSATERKKKEMYEKYEKQLSQTNHIIPVYVVKQELARSTLDTDKVPYIQQRIGIESSSKSSPCFAGHVKF